ncbi:MAG: LysM peptidoglycan-binding domain-containing protein [Verrucomicrobiota bacterium JB023]|nr:LysM peptidoglycan-binding domain-containing protein [Verrucomicrobiota bacterium JB023]
MKASLAIFPAVLLVACTAPMNNPNNINQGGTYTDPNNPYAVPGVSTTGTYDPAPQVNAPYQPVAPTPVNPPAYTPVPSQAPVTIPSAGASTSVGGTTHTVSSGDTLWGLSRKYGVSVDSIRQANGLTGDTIITGQTLSIPR